MEGHRYRPTQSFQLQSIFFIMNILKSCEVAAMVTVCLVAGACHNNDNTGSETPNYRTLEDDTIEIAEGSNLNGKLQTETVEMKPYAVRINTTGVITPIPTEYAEIAAPLPGRTVKCHVTIGQTVRKGSALFDIASSDYSEIVKGYIQSRSEMQQAERSLNRVKDLYNNHVASTKELEEAQTAYNIAREEYNHSLAMTREYQINTESMAVGQPMTVRSPVSGKVLKNDIVIGEYLKEDSEAKVIVADLDKVWLKANISEKEAPIVDELRKVEIRTVAKSDSVIEGRIVYVGGMLDPETRTLQTIIECDNRKGNLMPNMYANLTLYGDESDHIIIPKEAVLQSGEGRYVLRKVSENRYSKTRVEVQSIDGQSVIVLSGLNAGDEIITKGAFYLIENQ